MTIVMVELYVFDDTYCVPEGNLLEIDVDLSKISTCCMNNMCDTVISRLLFDIVVKPSKHYACGNDNRASTLGPVVQKQVSLTLG